MSRRVVSDGFGDRGSFGQPLELPPHEPLWPIREDQKPEAQSNFVLKEGTFINIYIYSQYSVYIYILLLDHINIYIA